MKILLLANNDDGLYLFRRELIAQLLVNHEVVIALPAGERIAPLVEMGCCFVDIPVDRRGTNPATDMNLLRLYENLIKQEKPDMVITYTIKPNIYGGLVCRWLKIPYAVNITGLGTAFQESGLLRTLVTSFYKLALKNAGVVFFENAGNMQTLLDAGIARKEQCCLLAGAGVNVEHYAYTPYPEADHPTRFLFVGRVMREKGIDELFSAMQRLRQEGFQCTLDVLGSYEENYADKIDAYTKMGWLRYHGHQKDVRPFIENAHCFVLPSYHEGMANTNLECAAMGRPVITSNIHGCKEAVIENVSGLLCEPQNTDSLYDTMVRFLKLSQEERAAMGLAGRAHMEAIFDKRKVVAETMQALKLSDLASVKKICLIATVPMTVRSFLIPISRYYHENTDWDISILCDYDPDLEQEMPEGVHYIPVSMRRGIDWSGPSVMLKMRKVFKREQFDMVQYCTPNASMYASTAARMAKIPVRLYCQWGMVYVSMKGLKRRIFKQIEKYTCHNSTWVEPDSFGNLEFSHHEGLYPKDKGSVVWNGSTGGIDLVRYDVTQKAAWREEIRNKHGIPRDALAYGFVGRITGDKGINELYMAFQKLLQERPDAYLMMIGGTENEKTIREDLSRWANDESRVVFCGSTKEIEKYFAALDVHVLPSYREGFGSVIIEAEAMEVPVIVTAIPGPLEAMCPGKTGLTVQKQDVDSLLGAMAKLYDDAQLRKSLGKAGRQYVAERFEINEFYARTLADRKWLLRED